MPKQRQLKNCCRWTPVQALKYYFYMILHQDLLDKDKKRNRFYKNMSEFLNNDKDHKQCRSHHQKKMEEIQNIYGQNVSERWLLYKFYLQEVRLRRIDDDHLRYQLHCLLYELSQGCREEVMRRKYSECYDRLDENLASLKMLFDKYSNSLNQTEMQCQTEY